MKRISTKTIIMSLLFLLFNVFSMTVIYAEDDETVYMKKVISVVYDNSGSMTQKNSTKWADASYAMQSFTALLNSGDVLYITDTNAPNQNIFYQTKITLDGSRQEQVTSIRNKTATCNSNTYIESIDCAYEVLEKEKASNVDDYVQY